MANTVIISSNCPNGPSEILMKGEAGILFKNGDKNSLISSFEKFNQLSSEQINNFKIKAKKNSRKFSLFNHYKKLKKILNF